MAVAVPVAAAEIPEERQLPRLVDDGDVLTAGEEVELNALLDEVSERQQFDVVVVTVQDFTQSDVQNAAYDFYDYNGYGYGSDNDGVMLYLSMAERDYNLSATGYGITVFTDAGKEYMIDRILPMLGEDDYAAAFAAFAAMTDDFVTQARTGEPYDRGNMPAGESTFLVMAMMLWLVAAFALATVKARKEKAKLLSVAMKPEATEYVKEGSLDLKVSRRTLLYKQEVVVPLPKDPGGSGSSVTFGSSGVGHTSISGKF